MFIPIFTAVMSSLALYVCLRLIMPLPIGLGKRLLVCAAVVLVANRFIVQRQFGLVLPDGVFLVVAWLHAAVVLAFALALATDIAGLILRIAGVRLPSLGRCVVLCAASLVFSAVGVHQAVRVPPVVEITLKVPHLPPALEGFRIAHLADLHIGPLFRRDWVEQVVDRTLAAQPDMIALSGDVIDAPLAAIRDDIEPLSRLAAPHGVHVVAGNHEYIHGVDIWLGVFERLGMNVLYNSHTILDLDGAHLTVAGLADRSGLGRLQGEASDLDKALEGAPHKDTGGFRLLLSHQPHDAGAAPPYDVDLKLSGHTHGGQLLPFQLVSSRFNGGYVSGFYTIETMRLHVSNGTGLWAGFPVRLGVPSEITLITLSRCEDVLLAHCE